jgi:hypothetical protein
MKHEFGAVRQVDAVRQIGVVRQVGVLQQVGNKYVVPYDKNRNISNFAGRHRMTPALPTGYI